MMLKRISLSLVLAILGVSYAQTNAQTTPQTLSGDWESLSCELRPPAEQPTYLTRAISFTEIQVAARFTFYADASCEQALMTWFFSGDYEVLADSAVAQGVVDANLMINTLRITPHAAGIVDTLNSSEDGDCGKTLWEADTEQDVTETGCSLFGVTPNQKTTEYELLYTLDDYLFFGTRPLDGSSVDTEDKRPTALQIPLKRVPSSQ